MGGHHYCYIGRAERSWLISPRGKALLDLADGKRTVQEICTLFEEQFPSRTSYINATNDMRVFLQRGAMMVGDEP